MLPAVRVKSWPVLTEARSAPMEPFARTDAAAAEHVQAFADAVPGRPPANSRRENAATLSLREARYHRQLRRGLPGFLDFARGIHVRLQRSARRGASPPRSAWHVQLESRMSLTGTKADRQIKLAPVEIAAALEHLAVKVARKAGSPILQGSRLASLAARRGTGRVGQPPVGRAGPGPGAGIQTRLLRLRSFNPRRPRGWRWASYARLCGATRNTAHPAARAPWPPGKGRTPSGNPRGSCAPRPGWCTGHPACARWQSPDAA